MTALDTVNGDLAVRSVALTASDGQVAPPTEIQISPPGRVQTESKGEFVMDAAGRTSVMAAFARAGRDLVIDYEHQSATGGEAPAAGWITALADRGDGPDGGLWATVNWTERAATYLRNREYRYLSPILLVRKADRRAWRLHSVALTNTPEIQRLLPLMASEDVTIGEVWATQASPQQEEDRMREQLILMLKLAADATDEAIIAAVAERVGANRDSPALAPELREALSLSDTATPSEAVATIHALKQSQIPAERLTAMQAELTALKEQAAVRTRDELVAVALSQGKITPAQREWAEAYALRDPEGFRTFTAKAPAVAPVAGTITLPLKQSGGPGAPGIDETQQQINRALGIDEALWLKHQPKEG